MNGDGRVPCCQVALCNRLASYRATDGTGTNVYCCAEHLPFIQSMYPPSTPDEVDPVAVNSPGYRPPSIADGTVSQGLIDGLQHLIDEYGWTGVRRTLDEMPSIADEPDEAQQ